VDVDRPRRYLVHDERARQVNTPDAGFRTLLNWFLAGFADETPERIHAAGVWAAHTHGGPAEASSDDEVVEAGGSRLGSPKFAEPFRKLLENRPDELAERDTLDEHYARPMRAALATLARSRDGDAPFMARFLSAVAYSQGDWQAVADRWFKVTPYVGRAFTEQALRRLHKVYRAEPKPRYIRREISEAQSVAEYGDVA
jgi:hypothetical protein